MVNIIGFGNDAEAVRVRALGLDSFAAMSEYNKEDVKSLCRTLRKDVTTPMEIGPIVEKRLAQACSLRIHYDLLTRANNSTNLSKARILHHGKFMELMEKVKETKTPALEKVGQKYAISKLMEDFPPILENPDWGEGSSP